MGPINQFLNKYLSKWIFLLIGFVESGLYRKSYLNFMTVSLALGCCKFNATARHQHRAKELRERRKRQSQEARTWMFAECSQLEQDNRCIIHPIYLKHSFCKLFPPIRIVFQTQQVLVGQAAFWERALTCPPLFNDQHIIASPALMSFCPWP